MTTEQEDVESDAITNSFERRASRRFHARLQSEAGERAQSQKRLIRAVRRRGAVLQTAAARDEELQIKLMFRSGVYDESQHGCLSYPNANTRTPTQQCPKMLRGHVLLGISYFVRKYSPLGSGVVTGVCE